MVCIRSVFWNLVSILRNHPSRFTRYAVNSRTLFFIFVSSNSNFISLLKCFTYFIGLIPFPGFDRFYLRLFKNLVCILENCGLYLVSIFEKTGLYLVCNTDFFCTDCNCQHCILVVISILFWMENVKHSDRQ